MANDNETVDVMHELSVLNDLVWEYGDNRISEHEGSECAADGTVRDINEKFEIIKREIAAKDALISELADALEKTLCDFECEKTGKCISDLEDTDPVRDCPAFRKRELVAKAREVAR